MQSEARLSKAGGSFLAMCPWDVEVWFQSDSYLRLTVAEQGAYLNLCFRAWQRQPSCSLPDDDCILWKAAGCLSLEEWRTLRERVLGAGGWTLGESGWSHPTVSDTYSESAERWRKSVRAGRIAGKESARVRRELAKKKRHGTTVERSSTQGRSTIVDPPSPSPSPSTDTTDPQPIPFPEGRAQVVRILRSVTVPDESRGAERAIAAAFRKEGWDVQTQAGIADRGDGYAGRIDIVVSRAGFKAGIEIDRESPREKSFSKLASLEAHLKVIATRGSVREHETRGVWVMPLICDRDEQPKLGRDTWLTPYGEAWRERWGPESEPPWGEMAAALGRPQGRGRQSLHQRYGDELVLWWRRFLQAEDRAEWARPVRFIQGLGQWSGSAGAARHKGRGNDVDEEVTNLIGRRPPLLGGDG